MCERVCYGCGEEFDMRGVGNYYCEPCRRSHFALNNVTGAQPEEELKRVGFTLVTLPDLSQYQAKDNP